MEQTQKPRYIQGYWRNKEEPAAKPDGGEFIAYALLAGLALVAAIVFWQVTLALLFAVAAGTVINHFRPAPDEAPANDLVINYYNK